MSRGHTQATVSAIPLPEMAILSRWWAAGIVGPIAEARRTYLVMRSMASKMPDFDALFPAEADLTRGGGCRSSPGSRVQQAGVCLDGKLEERECRLKIKENYGRDLNKVIYRLMRRLDGGDFRPIDAGLLQATDGATDRVAARVPVSKRGPHPGKLKRSVRRTMYFTQSKGRRNVLIGYRTNHPALRRGRKTLPRQLQAVVGEYGSQERGYGSFTGEALRTVAKGIIFPRARVKFSRGFAASLRKTMRKDVIGTRFRVVG